ncbi:uncharacterized protein B0T23DRAFT_319101 [Neurospora hispaniola]|uniref:Uncharacterized protein n=1 Tax=Neurospora hispaniola TaxID=588809 RepID=A0AAJ0MQJ7_9PEZI|nr:hypothetical protein B0T23DRAFT_319101 [Neurospora hispaniola]
MQQHPQQLQHGQLRQQGQLPQQQFGGPQPQNLFMQPGKYQMQMPSPVQQAPHRGQRRVFAQTFQESDLPQQYFEPSQSPQQHAQVFQHPQQHGHNLQQPQKENAMETSNSPLGDLNLEDFDLDQALMMSVNDDFNFDDFGDLQVQQQQQQQQNVISQNAVNWPSENLFHDQTSQVAHQSRANSSVSLMTPRADNSYDLFNNNTPVQNSHNSFTITPAATPQNSFNNSPGQISNKSSNTTPVADSLNNFNTSPAGNAGDSPSFFNTSPVQDLSAGWGVENNNFGDLSASFSSASENHQNFVDLTGENVDFTGHNVAFGQVSQGATYGQIDPFASFASPLENSQQQVLSVAPENLHNVHEHQPFPNPGHAQSQGSPHIPTTPFPAQQPQPSPPKNSAKKRAPLPKKPAAKRPTKKARKTKTPTNDEQIADSEAIDNGYQNEAAISEYLWGAELLPQDYEYDLDAPLRNFSDSIPQRVPASENAPAPASNVTENDPLFDPTLASNAILQDIPVEGSAPPPAHNSLFDNDPFITPAPPSNGIENDPLVVFLNQENAKLNAMKQANQAQLNNVTTPEPSSPPKKRKRGNSTRTPNVSDTPAKKRKVSKKAKVKGRLSKSASSAKFGLGKGAGTGLNSPRTMYVFEDRAFYLIPANIMPAFLEFVSTPREIPVQQQFPTAQQQPLAQQQNFAQQQPAPVQQQPAVEQQEFSQQQPFDQQQPAPVQQQDLFQQQAAIEQPAPTQEEFEPAYDIEGRLLTLLDDDEVNEQNNDEDDPYAPAPRRPVPLSEAAIAFGFTSLPTERSPSSSHNPLPVQNPPQAFSSPAPALAPSSTSSPAAGNSNGTNTGNTSSYAILSASSDIVINPIPESSPRFIPDNREIIARFNLSPTGSGTERDVSHLEYFINLVHSSGLFACGHHDEIPGGFRWESWKTAEENLLALRPFFGTLTTKAWFEQWKKGENPVQLAEMEEDE